MKTEETDGYSAIQLGYGAQKAKRARKPELGHAAKASVDVAPAILREFAPDEGVEYELVPNLVLEGMAAIWEFNRR